MTFISRLRTLTAQLPGFIGGRVMVEGRVHRRRRLSSVSFLIIRDRSGLVQAVVTAVDHAYVHLHDYAEETVVRVTGTVVANPKAPGGVELVGPVVRVLAEAATPPVELWRPTIDVSLPVLLDHGPVTWRHPSRRAVWQVAADSVRGFRAALDAGGFVEIHTPKLVESATESGADVFAVDYFGRGHFRPRPVAAAVGAVQAAAPGRARRDEPHRPHSGQHPGRG